MPPISSPRRFSSCGSASTTFQPTKRRPGLGSLASQGGCYLDYHRAGVRRQGLADALSAQVVAAGEVTAPSPEAAAEVRALLGQLAQEDREIILLHAWEGFAHEEIAVIVGMKPATVRSRYARARAQLAASAGVKDGQRVPKVPLDLRRGRRVDEPQRLLCAVHARDR